MKEILAINPPLYDFSAYDLWLKPYGFLHLLASLKKRNIKVNYLDCLDRFHPGLKKYLPKPLKQNSYGRGKFPEQEVEKPSILNWVPRRYRRFGLPKELIEETIKPSQPDMILLTSGMSYWYLGIKEMVQLLRKFFPSVPILLGGTYASICSQHAQENSGVDFVIGRNGLIQLTQLIKDLLKEEISPEEFYQISPCYHYYSTLPYVVLRTSWGCPFNCSYCGIKYIQPNFIEREIELVFREIKAHYQKGILNFVFYDDALLFAKERIKYLLKKLLRENIVVCFHTPNGLHARFLDQELANLIGRAKFINPRLSLESSDPNFQVHSGGKVYNYEIERAVSFLRKAGYRDWEYSIYLLFGLPEEDLELVEKSISYLLKLKANPLLAEYSPIPGTKIAERIKYPLQEPLFHNNSIFPAYELKDWPRLQRLKDLARAKIKA